MLLKLLFVFEAVLATGFYRLLSVYAGHRRLMKLVPNTGADPVDAATSILVRRSVKRAAGLFPGATCLPQALAAQWMLSRRGYKAKLVVGVARQSRDNFAAHAWVISGDQIVIGGSRLELSKFSVLMEIGGA